MFKTNVGGIDRTNISSRQIPHQEALDRSTVQKADGLGADDLLAETGRGCRARGKHVEQQEEQESRQKSRHGRPPSERASGLFTFQSSSRIVGP